MTGPNPEGLLALEVHRHKTYFGSPKHRLCKAKSRRTGKPCGQVAMHGKNTCRHHGGHSKGRGKRIPMNQRSPRQQRNYYIREARRIAQAELGDRELHSETMTIFRQQYAARIYPSDVPRFLLLLDKYMLGQISSRAWQGSLEDFGAINANSGTSRDH